MADDLSQFHRDFGSLQSEVSNLKSEVTSLREAVADLTAVLNQAKGAKWAIFVLPALVSAAVAVASYFGLKMTFGNPIP